MCMQSLFHEEWSRAFGATQGSADALTYNPSDVFVGFPFPVEEGYLSSLSSSFSSRRTELLIEMGLGPTAAYGRFHQPSEDGLGISAFRELHLIANAEVAAAYGWTDLPTACGFGIDHLDLDEDVTLPEELQIRIDSGDVFFWQADDACAFQEQLQAITGSLRKLPWRYRWPDTVRDDVLARLLALNAERYAEERLHGPQIATQENRRQRVSRNTRTVSLNAVSSVQQPGLF